MGNAKRATQQSVEAARVTVSAITVVSDALSAASTSLPRRMPVGIDLSLTCTGVAWRLPSGVVCTQSIKTKMPRSAYTHHMQTERLYTITQTLSVICEGFATTADVDVMVESPAYGAPGRMVDIAQLHGAVRVMLR